MSRAQKILLAGYLLLRKFRDEQIDLSDDVRRAFAARIESWCAQAQTLEAP